MLTGFRNGVVEEGYCRGVWLKFLLTCGQSFIATVTFRGSERVP